MEPKFDLLGRTIERYKDSGHFINKYQDAKGDLYYFAFRQEGGLLTTLGMCSSLTAARTACGQYKEAPKIDTRPKKAYPQFTGTSRTR